MCYFIGSNICMLVAFCAVTSKFLNEFPCLLMAFSCVSVLCQTRCLSASTTSRYVVLSSFVYQSSECIVVWQTKLKFFKLFILFCRESLPICFVKMEVTLERHNLRDNCGIQLNANWALLCSGDCIQNKFAAEIGDVGARKCQVRVITFFPTLLLKDFGSLASWMRVRCSASACSSATFPSAVVSS